MVKTPWRLAGLVTLLAIILQLLAFVSSGGLPLGAGRAPMIVPQALRHMAGSPWLLFYAGYYALLVGALHFLPLAWLGRGVRQIAAALGFEAPQRLFLFLILLLTLLSAMAWSRQLAPDSRAVVASAALDGVLVAGVLRAWGVVALAVMLVGAIGSLSRLRSRWLMAGTGLLMVIILVLQVSTSGSPVQSARPNVIIIGLDSIRWDMESASDATGRLMPFLDEIRTNFVDFRDAETPIARTGVSWASILSGRYPVHSGARFNLHPRDLTDDSAWLPRVMAEAGYQTSYVTDDSRFSNIDRSYGFDAASHPPIGLQDFIFGTFADFVPVALLRASWLGKYLLPHQWGNRAADYSYRPAESSMRVIDAMDRLDGATPAFFLAHLCTAHFPYISEESEGVEGLRIDDEDVAATREVARYAAGMRAVDGELAHIWSELERRGFLENALVFILSDHGESLGLRRDQLTDAAASLPRNQRPVAMGHGTLALSDSQYKTVLLAQHFVRGKPQYQPRRDFSPASLVDVAPTVLGVADIAPTGGGGDGVNLLEAAGGIESERVRYRETDLRGASLAVMDLDPQRIALEFAGMFEITRDGRLEVRRSELSSLLSQKQRVAHREGTYLLNDPAGGTSSWLMYRRAERSLGIPAFEEDAEAAQLRTAMCAHWASDDLFVRGNCGGDSPGVAAAATASSAR